LRDAYNRKQRLTYWIRRVEGDLDGTDREDVLTFINHMKYNANSALWILRSITALISMRKMIGTSFRDCNTENIRKFIDLIENEMNYKASTIEKYKKILKFFYKVVYGKNEFYPEQVKWFSIKVSKDKIRESFVLDNAEYLEEEEIKVAVARASSVQRKAIISCMYESGARPEEFLMLQNTDIKIDSKGPDVRIDLKGAIFILRGKTGERRIRTVSFVNKLVQ
jgi:site-specific recombinase XerD